MKQLAGTARNVRLVPSGDGKLEPEIEAVLCGLEKNFRGSCSGVEMQEVLETIRIAMHPDSARALSERLIEWADEADELASAANGDD